MTSRDFCYWLQGFLEISGKSRNPEKPSLDKEQVECVGRHLAMVFKHEIDPSFGQQQPDLAKVHQGLTMGWGPDNIINC